MISGIKIHLSPIFDERIFKGFSLGRMEYDLEFFFIESREGAKISARNFWDDQTRLKKVFV